MNSERQDEVQENINMSNNQHRIEGAISQENTPSNEIDPSNQNSERQDEVQENINMNNN